jgi:hypothetical protein
LDLGQKQGFEIRGRMLQDFSQGFVEGTVEFGGSSGAGGIAQSVNAPLHEAVVPSP